MIAFSCPKCKTVVSICNIPAKPPITVFACVNPGCDYQHNVTNFTITIEAPTPKPESKGEPNTEIL